MTISIIAAIAENNVIGKNNDLIWHISEDLKRFKSITSGHTIIMGRKTYESLPFKPLPRRKNIVISSKNIKFEGAVTVKSPKEAIDLCKNEDEIFICGGAAIYEAFLPKAEKFYLTQVHESFSGDTFFPEINFDDWLILNSVDNKHDKKTGFRYSFKNMIKI